MPLPLKYGKPPPPRKLLMASICANLASITYAVYVIAARDTGMEHLTRWKDACAPLLLPTVAFVLLITAIIVSTPWQRPILFASAIVIFLVSLPVCFIALVVLANAGLPWDWGPGF
jgi:hypothetical protein